MMRYAVCDREEGTRSKAFSFLAPVLIAPRIDIDTYQPHQAHSLARLLEARLLAPPPLPTITSPDDQQGEDLHDPSQAPQQQQQPQLPAATDLLPMLLAAPRTALPAIGACVGLVAQGRLAGRQAVLCVSAIREVRRGLEIDGVWRRPSYMY